MRRGELQATSVIWAVLLISLIVTVITSIMAQGSQEYDTTFNEEEYATYVQLEAVRDQTEDIRDRSGRVGADSNVFDLIGNLFSDGYQAFKLSERSVDTIDVMTEEATTQLPLGSLADDFRNTAAAFIIVLIIIGIILAAIIKRNL